MSTRKRGRPVGSRNRPSTRTTRTNRDTNRDYNNRRTSSLRMVARQLPLEDEIAPFSVGDLSESCDYCNALHFKEEKVRDGFSQCCQKGKVVLTGLRELKECPEALKALYMGSDEESRNFQSNIRQYNSAFAFASQKVSLREFQSNGPYTFCLHGTSYSRIGSVVPQPGNAPQFCQLYTLDTEEALQQRFRHSANQDCNPLIMLKLDEMLREVNPFASAFQTMGETLRQERAKAVAEHRDLPDIRMVFARTDNDQRRYNLPTGDSVATIFVGDNGEPPSHIDFTVHAKNGPLQIISNLSSRMDPMVYPLLFPHGELGFTLGINHRSERSTAQRNNLTMLQFYAYRIAIRPGFSAIHSSGKLFQQYLCCSYVNQESNNLNWIRLNQPKLRTERYHGLMDYVEQEAAERNVPPGRVIILPSSYKGSPRNMQQNYQDAMAIVRKYGRPDLFITFTCNPKWPEIVNNIKPWEKPEHRPDLTARVFNLKLKEMLDDLFKKNIFGQVVAHVYVIEFQKRGLPHAHLLLILKDEHKMREPDQIDETVWAEIPDSTEYPRLYNSVLRHMIHGPCGVLNSNAPCMCNGTCQKEFPKSFQEETIVCDNGYPKYKRRDTNISIDRNGKPVDNRWVVPYNPYLLLKYDAHINVEICTSIKAIKYLYKYVYKGHDSAAVEIHQRVPRQNNEENMPMDVDRNNATAQPFNYDEIKTYLDARYVGPPEAVWRLLSLNMDGMSHVIKQLAIHLENQQNVVFVAGAEEAAIRSTSNKDTTLTAFFKLNSDPSSGAQDYLYHEIPNHFVWEMNTWKNRQRGGEIVIARMYQVSPKDTERFFLRLLLLHVRGPTSFNDLKTVNGVFYDTFLEAAKARNLLHDDEEWSKCLEEACLTQHPKQLRFLFAIICITAETLSNHLSLYEQFEPHMSEDFFYQGKTLEERRNLTLGDIESTLRLNGKTCADFGLPTQTPLLVNEEVYDYEKEKIEGQRLYTTLNNEQKQIVDKILESVTSNVPVAMFMDGPGGTGKTFVYRTLLHIVRGMQKVAIAVAPTGIAATLLPGGQTVHSRFKLPVPFNETSVSFLKPNSAQADLLRNCDLIVWDEAPMSPSLHLKEINRLLQEICSSTELFGGKTVLMGGDFRQTLPVVPRGTRSSIVNSCIKRSILWPQIAKASLTHNMRADESEQLFASWLLSIGNGEPLDEETYIEGCIKVPQECLVDNKVEDHVFGESLDPSLSESYRDKVILCPRNDDCLELNNRIVRKLPGQPKRYLSVDSVKCDDPEEERNYPIEFINSITPSGMPPHQLDLSVGAIVILLRNLNTKKGLCNGTRMIVEQLHNLFLDVTVLSGPAAGERVYIPRIDLAPSDTGLPFQLKRRQFPVNLAFAMTINKSQGQTFDSIGLYLSAPVFSHGQLYVAFSRVRRFSAIKVQIKNTENQGQHQNGLVYTRNVIFPEALE